MKTSIFFLFFALPSLAWAAPQAAGSGSFEYLILGLLAALLSVALAFLGSRLFPKKEQAQSNLLALEQALAKEKEQKLALQSRIEALQRAEQELTRRIEQLQQEREEQQAKPEGQEAKQGESFAVLYKRLDALEQGQGYQYKQPLAPEEFLRSVQENPELLQELKKHLQLDVLQSALLQILSGKALDTAQLDALQKETLPHFWAFYEREYLGGAKN